MITPVSGGGNVYANTPAPTETPKTHATNSQPTAGVQDKVELSSKAQTQLNSLSSALQEASETPAQTANEASHGDLQAKKILAKEAAAHQKGIPAKK